MQTSPGTLVPVGQMLMSEECGATVEAGLKQLKEWQWQYCLIDDSARCHQSDRTDCNHTEKAQDSPSFEL